TMVSGAAPTNQPTQLKCARLVSGRRPHASKHVPEPLRKANISGPAPTHAPRPSKADERPRSGRRKASATASASGEVSETRPEREGTRPGTEAQQGERAPALGRAQGSAAAQRQRRGE